MSGTTTPTPTQPSSNRGAIPAFLATSVFSAGAGYLGARILTSINPIAGLIYGATSGASAYLMRHLSQKCVPENPVLRIAIKVAEFFASIALGAIVATAAGYPLTFGAACVLHFASAATLIGGSICLVAVPMVVIIAIKACKDRTNFIQAAENILQSIKDKASTLSGRLNRAQATGWF